MCLSIYLSLSLSESLTESLTQSLTESISIYIYLSLSIYLSISIYLSLSICLYLSISIYLFLSISIHLSQSFNQSIYLSFYLSICLCIYLSICMSVCLSIYLSIYLSSCLSVCLSIYLYLSISIYLFLSIYLNPSISINQSIYLYVCLSIYLSIYLAVCLSVYLSIYLSNLSIYLSVCLSVYLSIDFFGLHRAYILHLDLSSLLNRYRSLRHTCASVTTNMHVNSFWRCASVPAIRNHSPHKGHICNHHSCYTPNGSGKCQSRWVLNFQTGRACQPTGGKFLGAAARKRGNFPHWALKDWKGLWREHSRLDIAPKTTNIVCTSVCFLLTTSIIWAMLTWGYTCGFFIVINQLPTGMQPPSIDLSVCSHPRKKLCVLVIVKPSPAWKPLLKQHVSGNMAA